MKPNPTANNIAQGRNKPLPDVITSAIPANLEVGLDAERYHEVGDVEALAEKLEVICNRPLERIKYDMGKYDWDRIAKQVSKIYDSL